MIITQLIKQITRLYLIFIFLKYPSPSINSTWLDINIKPYVPVAIMTCLLNDGGSNGGGGALIDREYSFSADTSDKFKELIINTKCALSIHRASAETLLTPLHINQLKINLLEIQCMLFGIHK